MVGPLFQTVFPPAPWFDAYPSDPWVFKGIMMTVLFQVTEGISWSILLPVAPLPSALVRTALPTLSASTWTGEFGGSSVAPTLHSVTG